MPRPKGSKNKAALTIDEQIDQLTAEIEDMQEQVKVKKAKLKSLNDQKDEADKQRLMDMIVASGKSVDEIISMLNGVVEHEL